MKSSIRAALKYLYKIKTKIIPTVYVDRFPFLQAIINRLAAASRVNYVEDVLGHKMYLDHLDSLSLSTRGVYEPLETRFFQENVKAGQYVLDIGANIGYYTLLFARQVGEQGRVYAFEPEPVNYSLLSRNLIANGYKNVVAVNKAVSDKAGEIDLNLSEENSGGHRTFQTAPRGKTIRVNAIALDDFLKDIPHPFDWIKMDIQGAELFALKGMERMLRNNDRIVLVTEFWPAGLTQTASDPREYLQLLADVGFDLYEFSADARRLRRVDPDYLLKTYSPQSHPAPYTNLVCKKSS